MQKIQFNKKIYPCEIIDEAIEAFKDFPIAYDENDEHYRTVMIHGQDNYLKGEFCNYVLEILLAIFLKALTFFIILGNASTISLSCALKSAAGFE